MTEEREALIAHALDIATKGVQINDGHKYLVAAADLVDFAETIKALTEMLRPQDTETPPLPNHCQECGVWGGVEAHLRTCSRYQRDGYAEQDSETPA